MAALLIGATAGAVALDRGGVRTRAPDNQADALPSNPPASSPPATDPATPVSPSGGVSPQGSGESLAQQLERVATAVADIRGLDFDQVPDPTFLPSDELAERAGGLAEDYSAGDAETDRRILTTLGAIRPSVDLRELLSGTLAEQVAGFYDTETDELVIGRTNRGEGRLGPLDEITLAHELEHALADQALGLPDLGQGDNSGKEDAAFAATALVEGDATLTMTRYASRELSAIDRMQLLANQSDQITGMEQLEELPHVLRRTLTFPYEEGPRFVSVLFQDGGWEAVNAAYRQPPESTLQVLRPELYRRNQGSGGQPPDLGSPGPAWQRDQSMSLGAADLLFLFEAPGDDTAEALPDPETAATRWRAGEIVLWTDGSRSAVGVALSGQSGLCDAMRTWYVRAFPEADVARGSDGERTTTRFDGADQDAALVCSATTDANDGQAVSLGIAPDLNAAGAIIDR